MTTERWQRIKQIFREALQLDPDERGPFLSEACREDPALRKEVEALLASHEDSKSFMELPTEARLFDDEDGVASGELPAFTRIDQYHLKRVISTGGMGTVYQALQENPHRTVALKVMREGFVSKSAMRRFEYEARILAKLTHPHIAQVIEAGTHREEGQERASGTPFFVMEYIKEARPITEYAWGNKLSVHDRLRLFLQVCDAVHFGHQKGIIHRDLKPSNILVDASGHVKVIDFGIARATDSDMTLTTAHTDAGQLIGTLQYMSPEQCRADSSDLDVRSDVYALGVVLYELLCEQLPYKLSKSVMLEATRVIREAPPRKPSMVNRILRGDVETIVLKALEKDRDRRYQTLAALGEDVERFLRGEIILARPAGPAYRIWKRIQRNPVVSGAVGIALAALIAFFLYVVLWSYPQIRMERNRAVKALDEADIQRKTALDALQRLERESQNTLEVNAFLEEMIKSANPSAGGPEATIMEFLDRAEEKIAGRFPDRPEIETRIRSTIGETYLNNGFYEAAEAQFRRALEIDRRIFGEGYEGTINDLHNLALVLEKQGRYEEAEPLFLDSLKSCRAVFGADHPNTINILNSLALLYRYLGRYDEAESLFLEALEGSRRALDEDHVITLATLDNLAGLYQMQSRFAEAEPLLQEALEGRRRTLGADDPYTLISLNNLASFYMNQGRYGEAEPLFLETLEARRRILSEDHPDTLASLNNLACLYLFQGRHEEAEPLFLEALEGRRRVLDENHPDTILTLSNLGSLYMRQGRLEDALPLSQQALAAYRISLGDGHPNTLTTMINLAVLYEGMGRCDKAEPLAREAVERADEHHPKLKEWKKFLDRIRKALHQE